jgi:hypothetical protein
LSDAALSSFLLISFKLCNLLSFFHFIRLNKKKII